MKNTLKIFTGGFLLVSTLVNAQNKISEDILVNKTFIAFTDSLKKLEMYSEVDTFYFQDPSLEKMIDTIDYRPIYSDRTWDTLINGFYYHFTSRDDYWIAKSKMPKPLYVIEFKVVSITPEMVKVLYRVRKKEFKNKLFQKEALYSETIGPAILFKLKTTGGLRQYLE